MNIIDEIGKNIINTVAERVSKKAGSEEVDNDKVNVFLDRDKIFDIGDTVRVHYKIVEGKRERVQVFEGYVIAVKGSGISKTFKVRKISYGIGVERTFPLYSPNIAKVEMMRRGRVRRAKLYYLRKRTGKRAMIKEKINFKKAALKKK